ncbi:transferrin isoform X4 [Cimex lectularius]|uniref:Transferrin-like domain-containing protein n=1 Tax=Cimex lectularius TaxID=79782 RepID=A0A8I6RQ01_CIMLE|nr:transferrin isoform X4 [Cimex lectularius]
MEGVSVRLGFLLVFAFFGQNLAIYKICAPPSLSVEMCQGLELGNSNISCVRVTDGVGCILALKDNLVDLAILNAEESVLVAQKQDLSAYVIGEIRSERYHMDDSAAEMVVVIRANVSLKDNTKPRYCHPGVGVSRHYTDRFLKSFENSVVSKSCRRLSAVEQEIYDLHSFFGDSCRPGIWAQDDYVDKYLKRQYSKLCRLCDLPDSCQNNYHHGSPHSEALECLRNKGDVAFVTLPTLVEDAKSNGQNYDDFRLFCPDETTMPVLTNEPCYWSRQPWDLVVARSDVASELQPKVLSWLSPEGKSSADKWQSTLRDAVLGGTKTFIQKEVKPVGQFIDRGVVDRSDDSPQCQEALRWCTVSDLENDKCTWLKYAGDTHGIKPAIDCVKAPNLLTCLEFISKGKADAVSINTDLGFIARQKYKLSTIVYEDSSHTGNYKIIAVVKANANPEVKSFQDLKNKKACFPEYNGLSWLAFSNFVTENGLLGPKQCPERYFSSACAPGASQLFLRPDEKPKQSLCSLCAYQDGINECNPSPSRRERNIKAIKCLDSYGDVAFVNYEALGLDRMDNTSSLTSKYKVLCRNGSLVSGLDVGSECALATGIRAEIVGRREKTPEKFLDWSELFLQLNNWFGTTSQTKEGVLRMFGQFQNGTQLLFKDSTIALVSADVGSYDMINSYKGLLDSSSKVCSGTSHLLPSFCLLIFSSFFFSKLLISF